MRSRSRSDVYSRGETDRGLARAHTTANLLSIESESGILEVCVRARLHPVGAPVVYLPVLSRQGYCKRDLYKSHSRRCIKQGVAGEILRPSSQAVQTSSDTGNANTGFVHYQMETPAEVTAPGN